jgi:hypothetical protein
MEDSFDMHISPLAVWPEGWSELALHLREAETERRLGDHSGHGNCGLQEVVPISHNSTAAITVTPAAMPSMAASFSIASRSMPFTIPSRYDRWPD